MAPGNENRLRYLFCVALVLAGTSCRDTTPTSSQSAPVAARERDAAADSKSPAPLAVIHHCHHERSGKTERLSFLVQFHLEGHAVELGETGEPVAITELEHAPSAIRVDCESEGGRSLCSGARLLGLDRVASTHQITASDLVTVSLVDIVDRKVALARAREELSFLEDQLRELGPTAVARATEQRELVERTLTARDGDSEDGDRKRGFLVETSDQLLIAVDLDGNQVTVLTTGTEWLASATASCSASPR